MKLRRVLPWADAGGGRWRWVLTLAAAVLAVSVTWHVAFTAFAVGRGTMDEFVAVWVYTAGLVAATVLCAGRALTVPVDRGAWRALAAAVAAWTLGDVYFTAALVNDPTPPFPSPADAGYLLTYPAAYLGLGLLVRARVRRFQASLWLDGLVGTLAVGALGAEFVVAPLLRDLGGQFSTVVVNAAYPLADLVLLSILVAMFAVSGWRPGRAWLLLGLGIALLAAADSSYLLRITSGSYHYGTILDSLWLISFTLLASAAWQPLDPPRPISLDGLRVLVPPLVFTLIAMGLLLAGSLTRIALASALLAAAAVLAGIARVAMTFWEVRTLAETRRQALTDDLTGLANRRRFMRDMSARLSRAHARGDRFALVMIDLDRFKELNDTLGHHAGDALLQQIGPRMGSVLRSGDLLARLGGDEFAVLLDDVDGSLVVAQRLLDTLRAGFVIDDISVQAQASVGIAIFPDHATDPQTLLQRADIAMYQAKAARRGPQFYAADRDEHSRDRLAMINELRDAIDDGQLVLHYQPLVRLAGGDITTVEALVRWQHPTRGLIAPDVFIPLAEQTGVMRSLTLRVLDDALSQLRIWRDDRGLEMSVAVNVSATNLHDEHFTEDVRNAIQRHKIPASALTVEVTENMIMSDPDCATGVLCALSEMGVRIALDDFGTGYSSLAQLRRLAVDELKIDRSFVMSMGASDDDAAIVRSTIELAHSLRLSVIAEGVEDIEALDQLCLLGAEHAQGYYFSRPLPAADFLAWMDERDATTIAASTVPTHGR